MSDTATTAPASSRPPLPDADRVSDTFSERAKNYDLLTGFNPGYHRHLRRTATDLVDRLGSGHLRLLDLGCGSGSSTDALVQAVVGAGAGERTQVIGMDASAGMLGVARAKRWPQWVHFRERRAQELAAATDPEGEYDGIQAAYLVRNVPQRDQLLADLHAVLKPGGVLTIQDYAPSNALARAIWTAVCWTVVIPLAALVDRDTALYRYLWRSVLDFDSVDRLCERLTDAGFVDVEHHTVSGWQRGILHTIRARRAA